MKRPFIHFIMIPLALSVFPAIFLMASKEYLNPAWRFLSGIQFLMMKEEDIKRYSVGAKSIGKAKEAKIKSERVYYQKYSLTRELLKDLPYFNQLHFMWAFFVAGITLSILTIVFGILDIHSLRSQLDTFCYIEFVVYILLLRFGMASASYSKSNRKFTFAFMLLVGILSFLVLSKWNLGPYNVSAIIQLYLNMNKHVINLLISFMNSIIALALCTPMLQEFHGYIKITRPPSEFLSYQFCIELFSRMVKWPRRIVNLIYKITPFVPILCYLPRIYFQNDTLFDIIFVSIEMIIAIFKLMNVSDQIQVLILTPIKALYAFEEKRTDKSGNYAIACLNRSSLLPGFWATSMCLHPMIVLLLGSMYFSHYYIEGFLNIIMNFFTIYLIVISDIIMSFYHVVGIFISGD